MDLGNTKELDSLSVDEMCELARDPGNESKLTEYLGADQYRQLSEVVQSSSLANSRSATGTIVLLHGVMGSQIGISRRRTWDIVWLNPLAVRDGNFSLLKLGSGPSRYGARGLLPMYYTLLWARLKFWYGYKIVEFAYDWRVGIQESGDELVDFINQETTGTVYLVAHSMGGLVARAALPKLDARVQKIVQLAAPNYGSFSPVVTLRGKNQFINNFLKLDPSNSVIDAISNTVSTFQGLYEMFPAPDRFTQVDLFNAKVWPNSPKVNSAGLAAAKAAIANLPGPDQRFVLIAGTNQKTATDMSIDANGEFQFVTTTSGDGTVPLQFARFDPRDQVPTYLANVTHNGIVADGTVSAAIDDILRTGQTSRLPRDTGRQARGEIPTPLDVGEAATALRSGDPDSLPPSAVRAIQREVLGPLQPADQTSGRGNDLGGSGGAGGGGIPSVSGCGSSGSSGFDNIVVSRRRRRLHIVMANGDITQVPAHSHVLGVFEGVTPSGPACAFDELLNGAVSDLFERKMFAGELGRIYFMPTYKAAIPGNILTFAGLGNFRDFQPAVAENVAQQVIQSLLQVRVNELATVIFGGSFDDYQGYLCSLLKGFIAGLEEVDHDLEFQRVILCENKPDKFVALQQELYRLASSKLFDGVEVEFSAKTFPNRGTTRGTVTLPAPSELPVVLFSRFSIDLSSGTGETNYHHDITLLPPKSGTSIQRFSQQFAKQELDTLLRVTQTGAPANLDRFGTQLAKLVLPDELITGYKDVLSSCGVQLVHDALSTRIPWESLSFDGVWPAILQGLSRKYERNQSTRMFSRAQQQNKMLRILLVYDPTENLSGAEKEGERLMKVVAKWSRQMQVTALHGQDATRDAILDHLSNDEFDVLHYAGHAGYVAENPNQSGLLCAGNKVLSGQDLKPLGQRLPPVIVLNACQSGRVRKVSTEIVENAPASAAEAILNAGIMCFIATYWPVSDAGADVFAEKFYDGVLSGLQPGGTDTSVGQALLSARQTLKAQGENDWANYMLYGDPDFILKKSAAQS